MGRKQSVFVGDTFIIKGQIAEVMEYNSNLSIKIRFLQDGYETYSRSSRIKSGNIRNPLKVTVAGVGFTGVGKHVAESSNKTYYTWLNMLRRCYNSVVQKDCPTYIGCTVEEHWHNFQNFAEWYEMAFTGNKVGWEVDKDILKPGNKVYSRETCIPLPSEINCLLLKSEKTRGTCCIGVSFHSRDHVFQANGCTVDQRSIYLGSYSDEQSAFNAYKTFKESYIKQQANKWKDQIDPRAYEALMNHQVEITD